MHKTRIGLLTKTLLQRRALLQRQPRLTQAYSSLRRVRQTGKCSFKKSIFAVIAELVIF
jgi:hypothetical protein